MSTDVVVPPENNSWRSLYRAALFEPDKTKLCNRIVDAETVLKSRARELFHCGGDPTERQSVDTALYALHALMTACVPKANKNKALLRM